MKNIRQICIFFILFKQSVMKVDSTLNIPMKCENWMKALNVFFFQNTISKTIYGLFAMHLIKLSLKFFFCWIQSTYKNAISSLYCANEVNKNILIFQSLCLSHSHTHTQYEIRVISFSLCDSISSSSLKECNKWVMR